ncbi:helix-turn-helix transcriptional regulator [Nocardia sp. NPDC051981]|uniref:helix-turn-helix domain-containing protein n=1 Tax=Nocardia sp. NPDC051981 TaxID=3155417 RepID=UPI00341D8E00
MRHEARRRRGDQVPALTTMETAIMLLVADGLTDKQIADRLFFTEHTIDGYITQVHRRLGLNTRAQLRAHAGIKAGSRRGGLPGVSVARRPRGRLRNSSVAARWIDSQTG